MQQIFFFASPRIPANASGQIIAHYDGRLSTSSNSTNSPGNVATYSLNDQFDAVRAWQSENFSEKSNAFVCLSSVACLNLAQRAGVQKLPMFRVITLLPSPSSCSTQQHSTFLARCYQWWEVENRKIKISELLEAFPTKFAKTSKFRCLHAHCTSVLINQNLASILWVAFRLK